MSADTIARLKITLNEVTVAVLCWIEVPLAISEWIGDDLDLKWSMPMNSPEQSRRGRNAGLDDPPQVVRDLPDPRCSPEGYLGVCLGTTEGPRGTEERLHHNARRLCQIFSSRSAFRSEVYANGCSYKMQLPEDYA